MLYRSYPLHRNFTRNRQLPNVPTQNLMMPPPTNQPINERTNERTNQTDKPKYYWFEVLECVRRLLLASIIGIVSQDAAAAPVLGIFICLVFCFIFTNEKPYADPSNSGLSILLAFSLTLFFLAALMMKVDVTSDDKSDQNIFGALLIFLFFAGPLAVVGQASLDIVYWKHRKGPDDTTPVTTLTTTMDTPVRDTTDEEAGRVRRQQSQSRELNPQSLPLRGSLATPSTSQRTHSGSSTTKKVDSKAPAPHDLKSPSARRSSLTGTMTRRAEVASQRESMIPASATKGVASRTTAMSKSQRRENSLDRISDSQRTPTTKTQPGTKNFERRL